MAIGKDITDEKSMFKAFKLILKLTECYLQNKQAIPQKYNVA